MAVVQLLTTLYSPTGQFEELFKNNKYLFYINKKLIIIKPASFLEEEKKLKEKTDIIENLKKSDLSINELKIEMLNLLNII